MITQAQANKSFTDLAKGSLKSVVAGRRPEDEGRESLIVQDILNKFGYFAANSLLDIGCGYSGLTEKLFEAFIKNDLAVTAIDIPEIIKLCRIDNRLFTFISGNFPLKIERKFDYILAYSVLHYVDNPFDFIQKAIELLNPGGKMLVGDIPNINKKARFLSSEFGRKFDAEYKNVPLDSVPKYKNPQEYIENQKETFLLTDVFLQKCMNWAFNHDCEAYLLPQPSVLPFSYTREDLLIVRYE